MEHDDTQTERYDVEQLLLQLEMDGVSIMELSRLVANQILYLFLARADQDVDALASWYYVLTELKLRWEEAHAPIAESQAASAFWPSEMDGCDWAEAVLCRINLAVLTYSVASGTRLHEAIQHFDRVMPQKTIYTDFLCVAYIDLCICLHLKYNSEEAIQNGLEAETQSWADILARVIDPSRRDSMTLLAQELFESRKKAQSKYLLRWWCQIAVQNIMSSQITAPPSQSSLSNVFHRGIDISTQTQNDENNDVVPAIEGSFYSYATNASSATENSTTVLYGGAGADSGFFIRLLRHWQCWWESRPTQSQNATRILFVN